MIGKELLAKAKPEPAHRQRVPRRRHRRGRAGRGHPRGPHRRRRHRRVRHGAHHRVAAVRARRRWSSRRTSAPARPRPRTRPATRSPSRSAWPWPASSCPSPSTSAPPRRRDGAPVPARWPSGSGSSTPRSAAGVPDVLEIDYEGQLADYDTRILTLSVLKGVFGEVSEEPVTYVNAPRLAEERGVEVRESSSVDVARLRQPRHRPRRRPRHRRHARRACGASPAS